MDYAALIIALGSVLTAVATVYKYRVDAQQSAKQSDLDTLKLTFDALRATVDELQQQRAAQQERIKKLESQIETLTAKNRELERARSVLTDRVTELAVENEKLHEHVNKLRAELSEYKQNGQQRVS